VKFEFSEQIFEYPQISNFMEIRGVWDELFRADRTMDRRMAKASSHFSQFCEHA